MGGDGTVHEVVNGLAGRDGTTLAVVPRGTGTDFVRTFGIPKRFDKAVEVALGGRTRRIDVGRASYRAWSGGEGSIYFANLASVGMSGAIARRTNEGSKRLGKLAYVWPTLRVFAAWSAAEVEVEVASERRSGRMHDVMVANGRYLAGGMKVCPDAEPDDGLFDVLVIGDLSKRDLVANLPRLYRGTHLPHPKAELLRGATVTVDARDPLPVEVDGEQPGTTPVRFEIVPRALSLRVP